MQRAHVALVVQPARQPAQRLQQCKAVKLQPARRIPLLPRFDGTGRWRSIPFNMSYVTLVIGFGFLWGSIHATALLPTGFIPDEDTSRVVASVELPPGSTLEDTRVTTDQIVDALRTIPEVTQVFVLGGSSPTGQREVRRAAVTIKLKPKAERTARQKDLKVVIAQKLATATAPVAFILPLQGIQEWDKQGEPLFDPEGLEAFVDEMRRAMPASATFEEIDAHINSAEFSAKALEIFDRWVAEKVVAEGRP